MFTKQSLTNQYGVSLYYAIWWAGNTLWYLAATTSA